MEKDIHKYDDIMDFPHHQSPTRPHMSVHDRAAQFSPFAALVGYGDAVRETARLTDERPELDEDTKTSLDEALRVIRESPNGQQVSILYFKPDPKKAGGAHLSVTGSVKKIDPYGRTVALEDGTVIPVDDILDIAIY